MVFVQTHRKPSLTFWYECITFSLTRQTSFRWLKQFAMARFNFYANFIQGHTSFVLAHASKKFLCSNFIQIMTKGLDPSTFRMGNISASLKRLRTFSYTDTKSISPKCMILICCRTRLCEETQIHLGKIIIKSYFTSKFCNTK